jgi:hypothetical protein
MRLWRETNLETDPPPWALTAVDQARYENDCGAKLVQFLDHYLNGEDYSSLWTNVGAGVDVYLRDPGLQATQVLSRPRVVLWPIAEEDQPTIAQAPTSDDDPTLVNWFVSLKTLTWEIEVLTDMGTEEPESLGTGGGLTCADLTSSISRIWEQHFPDFAAAGLTPYPQMEKEPAREEADTRRWIATLRVKLILAVLGEKVG